jgi:hypothetical protein
VMRADGVDAEMLERDLRSMAQMIEMNSRFATDSRWHGNEWRRNTN